MPHDNKATRLTLHEAAIYVRKSILGPELSVGRRRHDRKSGTRIDLRRPAVLIDADGTQTDVVILDVSSEGFRLEIKESLRVGECVTLRVERNQELRAQIRWTLGNEAGGVFLTPAADPNWTDPELGARSPS